MPTPAGELLVLQTNGSTISASGEIDTYTSQSLAAAIESAPPAVRLDLSQVEFLDSGGLRVLVEAHRTRSESGDSLTIVAPSAVVRRLFEISGVDGYLVIDDVADDGAGDQPDDNGPPP